MKAIEGAYASVWKSMNPYRVGTDLHGKGNDAIWTDPKRFEGVPPAAVLEAFVLAGPALYGLGVGAANAVRALASFGRKAAPESGA